MPRVVHGVPLVIGVERARRVRVTRVEVPREEHALRLRVCAGAVRLRVHLERAVAAIVEPAALTVAAEVVVVRAVLLHHDHHVLDVAQARRARPTGLAAGSADPIEEANTGQGSAERQP